MSLLRHDEIYPCDEGATTQGHALAHRMDEFRAGYSLAGYAPAEPASASPAGVHHAIPSVRRPSEMQRIENSVLTACLTQGDNPTEFLTRTSNAANAAKLADLRTQVESAETNYYNHQPPSSPNVPVAPEEFQAISHATGELDRVSFEVG